MNSTSNATSTESDPWVESGALVYVAITVVVSAAVIMCCSWFLVHNETTKRCCEGRHKKRYTEVDEEEIELNANFEETEDEHGKLDDAFTFDEGESEGEGSEEADGDLQACV
jgi:hypothetical protein|tara:strand:- start:2603 stop:2938 length:336 start_codon:yes stop_codon:yes gene_type:complete